MKTFADKIAVITGGGSGIGRELARQLAAAGCNVAVCDLLGDAMAETKRPFNANTRRILSGSALLSGTELAKVRELVKARGLDLSDEQIQEVVAERDRQYETGAPITAAAASTIILDGVKAGEWRILVGEDTKRIDQMVRERPDRAYDLEFYETVVKEVGWKVGR